MGYRGGDLLRTGTVWPAVRSLPRPVSAGCGQWPVWPAALGPWRERIRGGTAGPPAYGVHDDALYKSTAFTFTFTRTFGIKSSVWQRQTEKFANKEEEKSINEQHQWHHCCSCLENIKPWPSFQFNTYRSWLWYHSQHGRLNWHQLLIFIFSDIRRRSEFTRCFV